MHENIWNNAQPDSLLIPTNGADYRRLLAGAENKQRLVQQVCALCATEHKGNR